MNQKFSVKETLFWILCGVSLLLGVNLILHPLNIYTLILFGVSVMASLRLYVVDNDNTIEKEVRKAYQDYFDELKSEYLSGYITRASLHAMVCKITQSLEGDKYKFIKVRVLKQLERDTLRVS
ncbi:MAG: hypothetical protein NTX05_05960 [Fusobacteria bacterium]|nr:hypothetical protein [Fusobacteriota bacterium]